MTVDGKKVGKWTGIVVAVLTVVIVGSLMFLRHNQQHLDADQNMLVIQRWSKIVKNINDTQDGKIKSLEQRVEQLERRAK